MLEMKRGLSTKRCAVSRGDCGRGVQESGGTGGSRIGRRTAKNIPIPESWKRNGGVFDRKRLFQDSLRLCKA